MAAESAIASLEDVLTLTEADRRAADALIRDRLKSDVALVNQVGEYIIVSGGKRLRPLVHLLAARACGYTGTGHIQLAAVIEFIHTATLLHDDVVDGSDRRRGRDAAHTVWGNAASVLVGDFLYSRSFQLMVELDHMRVMEILADTTNRIAAGEVMQLMHIGDTELGEAGYLGVIESKTACLFEAAARLGAVLSGDRESEPALAEYGLKLGLAFQIADDLLDYRADDQALGKNLGDDLAEGKVTLPLILALQRAGAEDRSFLESVIGEACPGPRSGGGNEELSRVQEILGATGAFDDTAARAQALAREAEKCLETLEPGRETEALAVLARCSVDRTA